MIKRFIGRLKIIFDKAKLEFEKKTIKSGWLAHHGIQRSGTNFLLVCLRKYGLKVINRHDPERNDPGHKHFRWYSEKALIPSEIRNQYGNSITAYNIHDLNKACNFPVDTKHIVTFKERHTSLVSILNWGLRSKWFDSKGDAISAAERYLNDIDEYNKFWADLSEACPEYVQLVCYEHLMKDNAVLSDALCRLCFKVNSIELRVNEVSHSPKNRKSEVTYDDILHLL